MISPLTGYQIGHLIWYILKSYFTTQVMLVHILYLKLHRKLINLLSFECEKMKREKKYFFLSVQPLTFFGTPQSKSCQCGHHHLSFLLTSSQGGGTFLQKLSKQVKKLSLLYQIVCQNLIEKRRSCYASFNMVPVVWCWCFGQFHQSKIEK